MSVCARACVRVCVRVCVCVRARTDATAATPSFTTTPSSHAHTHPLCATYSCRYETHMMSLRRARLLDDALARFERMSTRQMFHNLHVHFE